MITNLLFQYLLEAKMTAEEIVLRGYASFAQGDMIALSKIYHKDCIITVNGTNALSGNYIGFDSFAINFLEKLEKTWSGFSLEIESRF